MKKNARFIILQMVLVIFIFTKANSQICYTCLGNNNNVTGTSASAFGNNNVITGSYSSALGSGNNISSTYSFIAGSFSTVQSLHSYIIGTSSIVNSGSTESYIFGSGSNAGNSKVMLIGHRLQSSAGSQIILGAGPIGGFLTCNKMYSLAVGFKSNVPTFFVSESPANGRTGNIGIGNNTDPLAKLHIKADALEDATLLLEATGSAKKASFLFKGGEAVLGTNSNNSLTFNTNSLARMVILADGKVGLGTTPSEKLDIDGNIRLRTNATIGTWSSNSLTFNTNSAARMTVGADGNIGINTTAPTQKLDIDGNIRLRNNAIIGTWSSNSLTFNTNSTAQMVILANGNVGIGVASPQYKLHVAGAAKFSNQVIIDAGGLYVNGEVKAKKYLATISPFPDFVFEPGYKLLSINEVESFIKENGHLPGVPDSADVEKNGIELGEMNALLLQKIEELTLYIIALEKKIQALETVVNTQE